MEIIYKDKPLISCIKGNVLWSSNRPFPIPETYYYSLNRNPFNMFLLMSKDMIDTIRRQVVILY